LLMEMICSVAKFGFNAASLMNCFSIPLSARKRRAASTYCGFGFPFASFLAIPSLSGSGGGNVGQPTQCLCSTFLSEALICLPAR
jgi:hypothetical protein